MKPAVMLGCGLLLCCVLLVPGALRAETGIPVQKSVVVALSDLDPAELIGFRVFGQEAWVFDRLGRRRTYDLVTGKCLAREDFAHPLLDFALIGSSPVLLTEAGRLEGLPAGQGFLEVPGCCQLEEAEGNLFLSGTGDASLLPAGATQTTRLPGLRLGLPAPDGFLWTVRRHATLRTWQVELLDFCGNRMKRSYRFSPQFDPVGLQLGPLGPEGELLVSFWTGTTRELALIGPNGRMLWRLPGPPPVGKRDLAWDPIGTLLVLEVRDGRAAIVRWAFAQPEG